jgi:hypothetical protein
MAVGAGSEPRAHPGQNQLLQLTAQLQKSCAVRGIGFLVGRKLILDRFSLWYSLGQEGACLPMVHRLSTPAVRARAMFYSQAERNRSCNLTTRTAQVRLEYGAGGSMTNKGLGFGKG